MSIRTGYKLFNLRKNGTLGSPITNRREVLSVGEWMKSEPHPKKDLKFRPFWHVMKQPYAPHLTEKGRIWCEVEVSIVEELKKPDSQGGIWWLADWLKITKVGIEV